VNTALIGSELTLRAMFSGGSVGYVSVDYKQRLGMSRGLPPTNILKVILSVLKNFPKLKKVLSSDAYPKLPD
jgi:hypothetical protein